MRDTDEECNEEECWELREEEECRELLENVVLSRIPNSGKPLAKPKPKPKSGMKVITGKDAETMKTTPEWLWKGFIPRGKLSAITGDPSTGKTTLVMSVMGDLTRGRALPGDEAKPPMNVLVISSEDAVGDTLSWQMGNADADRDHCFFVEGLLKVGELETTIRKHRIDWVVADSLTTHLPGNIDINSANAVANWLHPVGEIAERTGCAITFIRHVSKVASKAGKANDKHAGLGSVAQTAKFRSEILVKEKDEVRVITRVKGIGPKPERFAYNIVDPPTKDNDYGVVKWCDVPSWASKETKGKGSKVPKALGKAQAFLREFLKDGPKPAKETLEAGLKAGITEGTLKRAADGLVDKAKEGNGGWSWSLLPEAHVLVCGAGQEVQEAQAA